MRRVRLFLLFTALLHAEDTPRDVLQLARVRAHMSDMLARLPNYTCLQNIERSRRGPTGRTQLIDLVRIEVALVDGGELFAWPGSKNFEDTRIIDMVKGGAIGNGNFALHAKSVFQSSSPKFTFLGERILEGGRAAFRWDYVVAQESSGYTLRAEPHEAVVGYHGSIWVDAKTLDAIRLELYADDIPGKLRIKAASDAVEYRRVKLGEEDFLLPAKSELRLTGADGYESINRTAFSACRQYAGESKITFEDAAENRREAQDPERTLSLAGGVTLPVSLETPVTDGVSAVGDPITAILKKDVKIGSGLVAPKGAFLHGRITSLRHQDVRPSGWVVGFKFFELEWLNTRAALRAELMLVPTLVAPTPGSTLLQSAIAQAARENGMFFISGERLKLGRGFPMYWRTRPMEAEDKQ